jgi:hypothetical protein
MPSLLMSFLVIGGLSYGAVAMADTELPFQKAGLWETRSQQTIMGKTHDAVSKSCLSNEVQKQMKSMADGMNKQNMCTATTTHPSANTYVTESRCTGGLLTGSVIRTTTVYESDSVIHQEIHTQNGSTDSVARQDSRHLGSCPADMKPGDTVLSNGMKVNLASPH